MGFFQSDERAARREAERTRRATEEMTRYERERQMSSRDDDVFSDLIDTLFDESMWPIWIGLIVFLGGMYWLDHTFGWGLLAALKDFLSGLFKH